MPDGSRDLSYLTTEVEFTPVLACPWCESTDLGHLAMRGDGLEVKRCNACGLGFLGELPDDLGVFYDSEYFTRTTDDDGDSAPSGYERYEAAVTASNFRWLAMLVRCAAGADAKTLFDMGTATGTFLEIARTQGFEVSGSELVPEGAAAAQSKGLAVAPGPFNVEDWPAGSFDVVTALEVLEHVRDIRSTLAELGTLVADDGLLAFFVPNVPQRLIDEYGDDSIDFNKSFEHTLYFDAASLHSICDEVFGPGSLTLLEADGNEQGQMVSFALGFVRPQPADNRPERRLVAEAHGDNLDDIPTSYEAQAIALTAAKFGRFDQAQTALDRAAALEPDSPTLAVTTAQVMRNRGGLFGAIATLEDSPSLQHPESSEIAGALLREIVMDVLDVMGVNSDGPAEGFREVHRRIDRVAAMDDAVAASEASRAAAEAAYRERGFEIDALGRQVELAERILDSERSRAADLERSLGIAQQSARVAEDRATRAEGAAQNAQALADQLDQALNDIYVSRAWKSIGKLRGAKQRLSRIASRSAPIEDDADDLDAVADAPTLADAPAGRYPVTISVIMPVYNKGATMRDSIDSVLGQTLQDFEIIAWDDGSTDAGTLELLDELATLDRVVVVHAANHGVIGARNSAMRLAQGEFLVCLDPDDRFQPTYLEKAVLYLRSHPDISIVYPWQQTVGAKEERWQTHDLDPAQIAFSNHLPVCSVLRREVFTETGGFSPEMAGGVEDWEFWTHAADLGFQGRVIPESLFEYSYSDDPNESRDASARDQAADLARRIRSLHPNVGTARPRLPSESSVAHTIDLDPPNINPGTGRPIVLFVPWYTVGGADRVVTELVTHWTKQGRTVVAITTLGVVAGMEDRLDNLLGLTPYVYQLPSFLPGELWYPFVDRVLTVLPEASILNIGSTWFHEHATKLKRSHSDVRIVDQQFNDSGHIEGNQLARPAIDLTVTAYHSLNESFLEDGRPEGTVETVYVGIEPARVDEQDIAAAMNQAGLDRDQPYVAFVGRLSEEKRPEWLFPLADALHDREVEVVVVGMGPLAKKLRPDFEAHPGITWVEHVDDTAPIFAGAAATVLPSRIEGIPLTAMESLAVGTPVVATAVGGLPELKDVAGVHLVDPRDRLGFIKETIAVLDSSPHAAISLPDELTLHGMIERYDSLIDPGIAQR